MDDLFELVFEFIAGIVEEIALDKRIPRGIRCTVIAVFGIFLTGLFLVVGYLLESVVVMWIAAILAVITAIATPVLIIRNWRRG
ncbi:MAG: hypothetical protein E7511_07810 [Ruminococcus sp.]|nr:hypothetical protein [Ruminococcus sp.]MBQ7003188.1 hypothetical protein [Oscillospiraceae bacterium]